MKICSKCGLSKAEENFRFRNKAKNERAPWCRPCFALYEREQWISDPKRRSSNMECNKTRKTRNQRYIWDYLLAHPCIVCSEADPVVLEFDHRDPSMKTKDVSSLSRSSYSQKRIDQEIELCDVLCANCHRRKTAKQFGWHDRIGEWSA